MIPKKRTYYDIIERKEKELNNLENNTNEVKKSSIKEFIYSNKNIPIIWKTKKNYQNLVLDIFNDDSDFLKYLGSKKQKENKLNLNNDRPKTSIFEGKNRNVDINKKEKERLSFPKFTRPKKKLRMLLSPQAEVENIFDELKEKFPIKNKLKELFPHYNLDEDTKDKKSNYSYDKHNKNKISKFFVNHATTSKSKYLKKMEKNIYNNLFSRDNKISFSNGQNIIKNNNNDFEYKRKNRLRIMKKELNDPRIFNLLQNLNLYGPYFSYCPCCYDKNISFYKNIGRKQCISLLNYIKDDKLKEREIKESKSREIQKTNFF
jgi:hypothetical protein